MSEFKTVKVKGNYEINDKRFYIPVVAKHNCPFCQAPVKLCFEHDYLSYPVTNQVETVAGYCQGCDQNYFFDVILEISLKVSKEARDSDE